MSQTDSFVIKGLAGKKTLQGEVHIKGAKNAILKAMAASILFAEAVELKNVSDMADIESMSDLLVGLGAKVGNGKGTISIDAVKLSSTTLDPDISRSMRSSVVITGPILARHGKVSFPSPGGCVIGARPVDLFIEAYKKMGASVLEKDGMFKITTPKGGLKGADVFFPIQTVTGTETLMMAAVLAKGTTILRNCAIEPEIQSVAEWLNDCGAKIEGAGTTTITIHGLLDKDLSVRTSLDEAWKKAGKLLKAKKPYNAIPDRIETASFLFLGTLCVDDLLISKCEPRHLESVTNFLAASGVPLEIGKDFIHIKGNGKLKNHSFKSANIRTHEYPGFPTDIQPIAAVYLSQTIGESIIFETIFEGRFKYADDLNKLGANIKVMNPREILITGPTSYKALPAGEELTAHDIRAGFAIVLAALCAEGNSVVKNVHLIDRGYESLEKTLTVLGADVRRVHGEEVTD
jgi:UDP-N-acetylglucosamine 1-carboxyvinyltransferase